VWKHQHPVAIAKALRAIIHENADVEGAQEIFRVTSNG
jgi:DhnA family fructose-bisphosphate aldolase class Ia